MFNQNSLGTVYFISINKERLRNQRQQCPTREANERLQILVFEKNRTNAFLVEVTSRMPESINTDLNDISLAMLYFLRDLNVYTYP